MSLPPEIVRDLLAISVQMERDLKGVDVAGADAVRARGEARMRRLLGYHQTTALSKEPPGVGLDAAGEDSNSSMAEREPRPPAHLDDTAVRAEGGEQNPGQLDLDPTLGPPLQAIHVPQPAIIGANTNGPFRDPPMPEVSNINLKEAVRAPINDRLMELPIQNDKVVGREPSIVEVLVRVCLDIGAEATTATDQAIEQSVELATEALIKVLLALCGSEVEAHEVSLALLWARKHDESGLPKDSSIKWYFASGQSVSLFVGHSELRSLPRRFRRHLVESAPGGFGRPLAVVCASRGTSTSPIRVVGAVSPAITGLAIPDAHVLYQHVSSSAGPVLWLKPCRSFRFYENGRWTRQFIAPRDGLGWSIRDLECLTERILNRISAFRFSAEGGASHEAMEGMVRQMVRVALESSEQRRGGSIYLVPRGMASAAAELAGERGVNAGAGNSWARLEWSWKEAPIERAQLDPSRACLVFQQHQYCGATILLNFDRENLFSRINSSCPDSLVALKLSSDTIDVYAGGGRVTMPQALIYHPDRLRSQLHRAVGGFMAEVALSAIRESAAAGAPPLDGQHCWLVIGSRGVLDLLSDPFRKEGRGMHISSWVDVPDDRRRRIDELSHAELLHYFSLDGAMLVDIEDFRLRGVSTYFRGHGGRKNIAASITHDHRDVLALVVSQDGGTYLMHHDSRGDEYERDDFERFEVGHPRVPTSFR